MDHGPVGSPLTQKEHIDEYWMEHRVKVLDLAAFLDRLDRSAGDEADDFRLKATLDALKVLADGSGARVQRIQMIYSDPSTQLLPALDQKGAKGAYDPAAEVR